MATDIRDRLRKLGVHQGAAHVTPKPKRRTGLEALIAGDVVETAYGPAFVHTERFAPAHAHGRYALSEALAQSPRIAAQLAALDQGNLDLRRAAFIDTETTGLAGGTGVLAFLVGVGTFDAENAFTVRQYFLRSPAEEPAMLWHLADWLDQFEAVVSFNGRGFDLPLLNTRFTLARLRPRILTAPHLDLLSPARRVWRQRLESCRLSSLEDHILEVHRDQADVPGALIPQMYFDYLATGDAGEMPRVLYHNTYDILSMVTLSTHLIQLFDREQVTERNAGDLYALGKWHADQAQTEQAETYLRQALAAAEDTDLRQAAAMRLALLYKQLARRRDAVPLWETVGAQSAWPAIEASIELAKHFEWHDRDLPQALRWTEQGLSLVTGLPRGFARDELATALKHRRERLQRKIKPTR